VGNRLRFALSLNFREIGTVFNRRGLLPTNGMQQIFGVFEAAGISSLPSN
jgi:hypothetical protein